MNDVLTLLDQALDVGRKELGHLESGDVDGAETASFERGRLITEALDNPDRTDLDAMLSKLTQLKNLHGRITNEAKRLRQTLKTDLVNARKQGKRLSGYGQATRVTPMMQAKYISKRG